MGNKPEILSHIETKKKNLLLFYSIVAAEH